MLWGNVLNDMEELLKFLPLSLHFNQRQIRDAVLTCGDDDVGGLVDILDVGVLGDRDTLLHGKLKKSRIYTTKGN